MTNQKPQLVICRGIPGSGKTFFARQWVKEDTRNRARINRDDFRQLIYSLDAPLPYEMEKVISIAQQSAVKALLRKGISVIVDDTHIALKYVKQWADVARECNADFWVRDFSQVSLDDCIKRDKERQRTVGEKVIRDMHDRLRNSKQYEAEVPESYVYIADQTLPKAWMVDIDGTLAHHGNSGRSPYEWNRVHEDEPDDVISQLVRDLSISYQIVIMSGRDSVCADLTEKWLNEWEIPFDALIMRGQNDNRKDSIVKLELFKQNVVPNWNVVGVLDDRDQVIQAWRGIGLKCLQVQEGAF